MSYKISKYQATKVLNIRNQVIDVIGGLLEYGDVSVQDLHKLKDSIEGWKEDSLDNIFSFKPQQDLDDPTRANYYADKVLKDNPKVYSYKKETSWK